MTAEEMMRKALELLHEEYKNDTSDWTSARVSAYAFMFGATTNLMSKKKAKYLLEMVSEYVQKEQEKRSEQ